MAIEVWARHRLDEGLDSAVLVFVDERNDDEFAQILLVCDGDLNAGQLVSPEPLPDPEQAPEPGPSEQPRPRRIPMLPPRTKKRRRRRFLIMLEELDSGVHAFDSHVLIERALAAIERNEDPVSLNPANREEWGFIDTLPAIAGAGALESTTS